MVGAYNGGLMGTRSNKTRQGAPMMNVQRAFQGDSSLRDKVLHMEGVPLSGDDMSRYNPRAHLFLEHEVHGKSREWMLGKHGEYILLYEFPGKSVGHWVCGWELPDGSIHHFDPYGKSPNFYTPEKPYLQVLQQGPFSYSKTDYQGHSRSLDTCGRHCLVRLQFREHSDAEYTGLIHRNGNADEEVTLMTLNVTMEGKKHKQ